MADGASPAGKRAARLEGARGGERAGPTARGAAPALTLSLQFADPTHRAVLARHRVVRWVRAALAQPAELTIRVVGLDEGQALNRDFRARDAPTNVLTFAYDAGPPVVADLVLCAPVVEREAAELGVTLGDHYTHLIVHGTLHAQGFDHEADSDAERMEARETAILASLGIADPYAPQRRG